MPVSSGAAAHDDNGQEGCEGNGEGDGGDEDEDDNEDRGTGRQCGGGGGTCEGRERRTDQVAMVAGGVGGAVRVGGVEGVAEGPTPALPVREGDGPLPGPPLYGRER